MGAPSALQRHVRATLRLVRQIPPALWVAGVVLAGLTVTLVAWQISVTSARDAAQARFDGVADQITTMLQRRTIAHEQILRGGSGLFNLNNEVTRSQWRTYVASLRLEDNYPGIQGVGFSLRVAAADLDDHIRRIRAEGYPEYTVRPGSTRAEYHSIIYLEPFWGRNLRAFGYDMYSEATRREAMERARDSGEATLSGRVTLVQEGKSDVQAGFLLYLPVYRSGLPIGTTAERRNALLGFVYSPFRASDLMNNLVAGSFGDDVDLELFAGADLDPERLLYARNRGESGSVARFHGIRRIETGGTTWTLRFASRPGFEAAFVQSRNNLVLGAGLTLTLLIALLMYSLITRRDLAMAKAREAGQRLTRSEMRLRAVLESAADGILGVGPDGIIETANSAAEHIFGIDGRELQTRGVGRLIDGLDIEQMRELLAARGLHNSHGLSVRVDTQGRRADGSLFPLAVSISQFTLQEQDHYSLVVRDITEATLAEATLKLRERAIEASSNGIVIVDMNLPGQPVIYANEAFERITGYGREEIVGRNCRLLHADDGDQPGVAELRRAIVEKRPCQVLLRNYRKDGILFWNELSIAPVFDRDGEVSHFVGIQNDITERVLAEKTLAIRTKQMDAVFTLSPDGFVAFDDGNIVTNVNPAFLRMTGLDEHEVLGLHVDRFDERLCRLCDPAQAYSPTFAVADEGLRIEGDRRQAPRQTLYLLQPQKRVLQRAVRVGDQGIAERVVYFRDVTRETEVDRMKSEFLSTAAHELRTPMASIFGFSELLLHRKWDDGRRNDMTATINRQAGILVNLVNELLDLARIEARAGKDFRYRVQPLGPVIESAVAGLLVSGDPRPISVALTEDLPLVRIDEEKFAQSLTNVLSNAYKYSPDGGQILLTTLREEHDGRPVVGIRVRDHGIGMTAEEMGRLFERFFRADPSGRIPGTGLGMCLVKEITELHGGRVDVASEKGIGTTVTLWLPSANSGELKLAA